MDEKKQAMIEKQAKEILDSFAKALEKVEKEAGKAESYVDREEFMREEHEGKEPNDDFKNRILENSPEHNSDSIIAEKGDWK